MEKIKFGDIKIKPAFLNCPPAEDKLNAAREYLRNHGFLNKIICLDDDNYLVSGYVAYCVLKEIDYSEDRLIDIFRESDYVTKRTTYYHCRYSGDNGVLITRRFVTDRRDKTDYKVGDEVIIKLHFTEVQAVVVKIDRDVPIEYGKFFRPIVRKRK